MKRVTPWIAILMIFIALLPITIFADDEKTTEHLPFTLIKIDNKMMYVNADGVPEVNVYGYNKEKNRIFYVTQAGRPISIRWNDTRCYFGKGVKDYYKNTTTPDGYLVDKYGNVQLKQGQQSPEYLQQKAYYDAIADDIRNEFAILINEHRKANGKSELKESEKLQKGTQVRADEILQHKKFSHTRPDGSGPFTAFKDISFNTIGENIAYRSYSDYYSFTAKEIAQKFFTGWKDSPGHNENILNSNFSEHYLAISFGMERPQDEPFDRHIVYAVNIFCG